MATQPPRVNSLLLETIRGYKKAPKTKQIRIDTASASSIEQQHIVSNDEPSNIFSLLYLNEQLCTENNVEKCKAIQRLALVLRFYQNIINQYDLNGNEEQKDSKADKHNDLTSINHKFSDHYSLQNILDDYIHCIVKHNHTLEDMYNFINIKCDLSECHGIKRNHRDRTKQQLHNHDTISMIDILDQIHCYIVHTFDIGFQLTSKEKNQIKSTTHQYMLENETNDDHKDTVPITDGKYDAIRQILSEKRKQYKYMIGGLHRIEHSKFVTKIDNNNVKDTEEHKDDTKQQMDSDNNNNNVYSFGHRLYYWKSFENETDLDWSNRQTRYRFCDLYIAPKYADIKDELLSNSICVISRKEWDILHKKCIKYLNSAHCKHIVLQKYRFDEYEVCLSETLSINNLLALILYTDFTVLSYSFSASFRRNKNESISQWKRRHSNYHWWSRTLRETVEFYGNDINASNTKYFYHGISQQMVFPSTISAFNGPTSTTTELPVATTFATSNGVILHLTSFYKVGSGGYYFNCNWTSAFSNENERLFIGGYWPLSTVNILNCMNGNDYRVYVHALNILVAALNGMPLSTEQQQARKMDKRIMLKLLKNSAHTFDAYFMDIYNSFRRNIKYLYLDLFYLSDDYGKAQNTIYVGNDIDYYGYECLGEMFLTRPNEAIKSFIKLNVCNNFPNCRGIRLYYNGGFNETIMISKEYLEMIYNELQQNTFLGFVEIKKMKLCSNTLLADFKSQFEQINYKLWQDDGKLCIRRL